jgi:hypothetical protein
MSGRPSASAPGLRHAQKLWHACPCESAESQILVSRPGVELGAGNIMFCWWDAYCLARERSSSAFAIGVCRSSAASRSAPEGSPQALKTCQRARRPNNGPVLKACV